MPEAARLCKAESEFSSRFHVTPNRLLLLLPRVVLRAPASSRLCCSVTAGHAEESSVPRSQEQSTGQCQTCSCQIPRPTGRRRPEGGSAQKPGPQVPRWGPWPAEEGCDVGGGCLPRGGEREGEKQTRGRERTGITHPGLNKEHLV